MCRVEWGRAMVEAQRMSELAQLQRVCTQPPDIEAPYVEDQVIRNQEAEAPEPQLA